jgi:hypothetical protein
LSARAESRHGWPGMTPDNQELSPVVPRCPLGIAAYRAEMLQGGQTMSDPDRRNARRSHESIFWNMWLALIVVALGHEGFARE